MRLIGLAERALEALCARSRTRVAFGRTLAEQGVVMQQIADSRMEIEQARLLTLKAAHMMDTVGNKVARAEIAMIKVVAPNMALRVIDRAIQVHGGAGICEDFGLSARLGPRQDPASGGRSRRGAQPRRRADRAEEALAIRGETPRCTEIGDAHAEQDL